MPQPFVLGMLAAAPIAGDAGGPTDCPSRATVRVALRLALAASRYAFLSSVLDLTL
jgi:hypothetical protein